MTEKDLFRQLRATKIFQTTKLMRQVWMTKDLKHLISYQFNMGVMLERLG
jgi:hypothetical protein